MSNYGDHFGHGAVLPLKITMLFLLQSVHGTGIVTKQVMLCKQIEATLRRKSVNVIESRIWKHTYKANSCDVCGKLISFENFEGNNICPDLP